MGQGFVYNDDRDEISVPQGVYNGFILTRKGKGIESADKSAGDQYIKIKVRPHPIFKMEGSDMFTNLLVVCQRAKFQLFYDELNTLMTDYYENIDKNEQKRITD